MELQSIRQMKMISILLIVALILPVASAATMKIYPSDDAFVRSTSTSTNFQTDDWKHNLRAGYENSFGTDKSYLKFDLSSLQGKTVTSVNFSMFLVSNHDNPNLNLYYVNNTSWSESTLTWNNAPVTSTLIGTKSITSGGAPIRLSYNVNSYVSGGKLSLALMEDGGTGFANFYSKDLNTGSPGDEENWPYLTVSYDSGCITGADTGGDGNIDMIELLNYISSWKQGSVGMMDLLNAIGFWKAGTGC